MSAGRELIPRATIEEIVGYRNRALELYSEAFTAIERADTAIKAANEMAARAAGDVQVYVSSRENGCDEVGEFEKAVRLPQRQIYEAVARRLTDLRVWSWVVQRTDLEKLMDAEAKEKLRQQMRYVPAVKRVGWDDQNSRPLITLDEVESGMPPVTVENIYATLQQFALDAESIFRRGIANAFSKLDRRFRSHDGFKIGSRVILTYAFSSITGGLQYGSMRDRLLDIERAFAVIEQGGHLGAQYGGGVWALDQDRGHTFDPHQSLTETKYFRIRGYKNGNAHLWFTRDDLVEKVNKILAEWYGEVIGDGQTREPDIFGGAEFRLPARRFGFYPTPDEAAEKLLEHVHLYRDKGDAPLSILEPSAGTGNLSRRLAEERVGHESGRGWDKGPEYRYRAHVDCVEVQPGLATALRKEGIYRKVHTADFLQLQPDPASLYDRVVMNPPFDLERDIDHVMRAFKFLKPDGELHAIMSAGTEFRTTKKATAFRAIIEKMRGRFSDLPAGSFSEVGTNVNTVILRACKDGKSRYW